MAFTHDLNNTVALMENAGEVPTDVAAGCCTDIYIRVFSRIEGQEEVARKRGLC